MALNPDSFLVPGRDEVANGDKWNAIIAQSPLGIKLFSPTSPIRLGLTNLWGLSFSSSENASRLGSLPVSSTASTLNDAKDAVFCLVRPAQTPQPGFSFVTIKNFFQIIPEDFSPEFETLVNLIDANGPVSFILDDAANSRSALWTLSGMNYRTVVILVFKIPDIAIPPIRTFIQQTFGLAVQIQTAAPGSTPIRLSISWTISYTPKTSSPLTFGFTYEYSITLSVPINGFDMNFTFSALGVSLRIGNPSGARPPGSVLSRLNTALLNQNPTSTLGSVDLLDSSPFNTFFSNVDLWYISLTRSVNKSQIGNAIATPQFGALEWQINFIADWSASNGIVVALRYESRTSSFFGRLLFDSDGPSAALPPGVTLSDYARRQHNFDAMTDITSATSKKLPGPIDVWKLLGLKASAPSQIPHLLTAANLMVKKVPSGFIVSLQSVLRSDFAQSGGSNNNGNDKEAPNGFVWDLISINTLTSVAGPQRSLSVRVSTQMSLHPKSGSTIEPAVFAVDVAYEAGGSWILNGRVSDLKFALLYSFFHPSAQDFALKVLGDLELKDLNIFYTFHPSGSGEASSGKASSFFITGTIAFGDLELTLNYEYVSTQIQESGQSASHLYRTQQGMEPAKTPMMPKNNKDQWTFAAVLSSGSKNTTLDKIVNTLTGKNLLPEFIGGIEIQAGPGGNASVMLILRGTDDFTVLSLYLSLGTISVTLVFLSPSGNVQASGSSGSKSKMILRVSLDQIPIVPEIPLVKVMPMPFDKLLYLWLDDEGSGLSRKELGVINDELGTLSIGRIDFKEISKDSSLPAIRPGHHFMVVDKGNVILDHCFSEPNGQPPEGPPPNPPPPGGTVKEEAPPTKGAVEKKLPLISISALSLMFKSGLLGFEFDAMITLGSFINFSLLDFSLGVDLAVLTRLAATTPKFDLHGLALSLNAPPVKLDGIFVREVTAEKESYRGGVSLGFQTWNFLAVGEYAIITLEGAEFKSMFVYAKLMGPLMTIGFATVSGVRIGLGYNSAVRSPSIGDLPKFPFLTDSADSNGGNEPLKIVESMMAPSPSGPAWVAPKQNAYWVAAGLTLTAFGILSVTAAMMLQMQEQGCIISVFANGKAQLPCNVSPNATLFYVEIGMISEINTIEGYFTVQAALAPASHILVPNCRLTGGFALVNWFHPSPHSGDFVFTVGGYHRAYKPPAWYPIVERIGISFTLGGMINVTGGVYFAITPKCVMGGGSLHMGLDVGPVSAWLDIALDVFVQFKPFHYTADLQVSVGCAISIKVWFIHVRISASVGALLHIEGPDPFGGYATVDFYLFSFTIHFGGNALPPDAAKLDEFYQMVHQPGPDSAPSVPSSPPTDPMMAQIKFNLESGLSPQYQQPDTVTSSGPFQDTGSSKAWIVKSGTFNFTISCEFPLRTARLNSSTGFIDILTTTRNFAPFFASKPMHISTASTNQIFSDIEITIKNQDSVVLDGFTAVLIERPLPTALWGSYSEDDDPARNASPINLRKADNPTISLAVGISISRPENPENLIYSGIQSFDPAIALRTPLGPFALESSKDMDPAFIAAASPPVLEAESWNNFGHDWVTASIQSQNIVGSVPGEEGMLKMAAEWLGWNMIPVPESGDKEPWVLDGKLPKGLLQNFGTEYPVLPRTCGVFS